MGFFKSTSDSQLQIGSGTSNTTGGCFIAYGSDYSNSELAGSVRIRARTTTNYDLQIQSDGSLKWNGTLISPDSNNRCDLGSATKTFTNVYTYNLILRNSYVKRTVSNDYAALCGGADTSEDGLLIVYGKDSTTNPGGFKFRARNSSNSIDLVGWADGTLTWGSKNLAMYQDVIPRSLGPVMNNGELGCKNNTGTFAICSGTNSNSGGNIILYANEFGDANSIYRGAIGLYALLSASSYKSMFLYPDGTWTWRGTAVQLQSDKRLKQQITQIDNTLLDAWEDVELVQFKYNDAVNEKGDNARLHTGYVVQQINEACQKHNIDISEYGLYCHEEYPERTEEVTITNEDGTTSKETKVIEPAKEYYSLRYTETLVVECAYLRREVSKLKQQHENLEQRLKMLEQSVK